MNTNNLYLEQMMRNVARQLVAASGQEAKTLVQYVKLTNALNTNDQGEPTIAKGIQL